MPVASMPLFGVNIMGVDSLEAKLRFAVSPVISHQMSQNQFKDVADDSDITAQTLALSGVRQMFDSVSTLLLTM